MCKKVVEVALYRLTDVSDKYKTLEMCKKAVEEAPFSLEYVRDRYGDKNC